MRLGMSMARGKKQTPARPSLAARWQRNSHGSVAIEFALVSIPMLMFVFSTFAVAMHFFTTSALEHAVDSASRKLRTGQAQASAMTNQQFRDEICNSAFLDCSKLEIHMSSDDEWTNVSPAACTDAGGNMTSGSGSASGLVGDLAGCAGRAFVVTACYEWELAKIIPLIDVGTLSNGSGLIQASSAGRSEPHQFACP